jgi:YD repeat-containing protein
MSFRSLFVAVLWTCCLLCNAQYQKQPITLPTPNAASLGLFGEVPVSAFTGVAEVSIPLYMLHEGNIDVPISLSYHASGFRPDVHPGWVGSNWALLSGGVITRKVNGALPDEYSGLIKGYYLNAKALAPTYWSTVSFMKNMADTYDDTGADEFSFNFLHYSGTFYLDHTRQWAVRSSKKIKVIFDGNLLEPPLYSNDNLTTQYSPGNMPSCFGGFTMITEDGTQYVFGGDTNAIEFSISFLNQKIDWWKATAWYLTKIISTDGRQVVFSYNADRDPSKKSYTYICSFYESCGTVVKEDFEDQNSGTLTRSCSHSNTAFPIFGRYGGELISPVYLESIVTSSEKATFSRSFTDELKYDKEILLDYLSATSGCSLGGGSKYVFSYLETYNEVAGYCSDFSKLKTLMDKMKWSQLNGVSVISNTTQSLLKQYNLHYNNTPDERLRLGSVQEVSVDPALSSPGPYTFTYYPIANTRTNVPFNPGKGGEPHYASSLSDHWGFFNNRPTFITGGTSFETFDYNRYYEDRGVNPDDVYPAQGMLKTLTYATGGTTEFSYQYHTYGKRVKKLRNVDGDASKSLDVFPTDQYAGGVRIASIKSYDAGNPQIPPVVKEYIYKKGYAPGTDLNQLPSSGILAADAQYYWRKLNEVSNIANAYYSSELFSSQSVLPVSQNSAGTHIGYSEVVERSADGGYKIFKYSNFDDGHLDAKYINTLQPTTDNEGSIYEPYSLKDFERGKLIGEALYNSNGTILSNKTYHYRALNSTYVRGMNVRRFAPCNDGNLVYEGTSYKINTYLYEMDLEITSVYDQHYSQNNKPVTVTNRYVYNPYGLLSEVNSEKNNGLKHYVRYYYPSDLKNIVGGNPYTKMVKLNMLSPVVEKQELIETAPNVRSLTGGVITSYKEFFPGKIFKDTVYVLETTTPVLSAPETATKFVDATGTSPARLSYMDGYRPRVSYTWYPTGNVQEFVNVGRRKKIVDRPVTYLWGYNNAFPVAEIINATNQDVVNVLGQGTIDALNTNPGDDGELRQTLNTLRSSPVLKDAMITTYTYDPLAGMTSITDANNVTTYYEYDKLARLKIIKDSNNNVIKKMEYNYRVR